MKRAVAVLLLSAAVIVGPVIYQHLVSPQRWVLLNGCKENLRFHLATALEKFHKVHGVYPSKLHDLVPAYINEIPVCPATTAKILGYHLEGHGGVDTYSSGYHCESNGRQYELCCSGSHHREALELMGKDVTDNPKYYSQP